jgi:acyl carrier protein
MEDLIMVFAKVKEIIVSTLKLDPSKVTLEASLEHDLGADSLDVVEVLMSIEDEFKVEIPDEEIENIRTIGELAAYIENNQ